jgi:acyl-coenzyme A synthetase/AMP-(fatty) acid ligase
MSRRVDPALVPVQLGLPERRVAVGRAGTEEDRTYAELVRDVLQVRAVILEEALHCVVIPEDRYWFAVALLATWEAGAEALLPGSRAEGALASLQLEFPRAPTLHDSHRGFGLRVPDLVTSSQGAPDTRGPGVSPLRADRRIATLLTSGTTAESTRWGKSARQLLGEAAFWARHLDLSPTDSILSTVPPQHVYGLLFGVLLPLQVGASFGRSATLLPPEVAAAAATARATVLVSTPAHLRPLLTLQPGALDTVRLIVSSGAPLGVDTGRALRSRFGVEVIEVLGSTETGGIAERRDDGPWVPLPAVHLMVGDDERLIVRSPFVEDPEAGHVTEDRAELLPDGRLIHKARVDSVVKIGGRRLDCAEVEARALALPGVTDAACVPFEVDSLRGVEVWLVVAAPSWTPAGLRRALARHFEASLLPRSIRLLAALPRGEGGKLRKDALVAAVRTGPEDGEVTRPAFEVRRGPLRTEGGREVHSATVTVAADAACFAGHFPADPILPAVAQLVELVAPEVRHAWPDLGAVTGAPRLKWTAAIRPGATLTLELSRQPGAGRVDYVIGGAERPAASGTLVFSPAGSGASVSPSP